VEQGGRYMETLDKYPLVVTLEEIKAFTIGFYV
jgi:hypothetical protein